jgi:hypothetical protein
MIKMLMLRVKDKREQRFTTKNTEKTQSEKEEVPFVSFVPLVTFVVNLLPKSGLKSILQVTKMALSD